MAPATSELKPRRKHLKSRSGCRNCKQRKVKCGEEHPSCRNCLRRGEACDLLASPAAASPSRHSDSTQTHSPSSNRGPVALPPRGLLSTDDGGAGLTPLTMLDMELLHHYSISTSLTLSSDPVERNFFHESLPQWGFSHPYVLQCVLALAASHLAHFRPESRQYFYAHAKARHAAATSMATPLLSEISAENAIPMYCFGILTLFIAFASLRDVDNLLPDTNDVLPSWLALFRGVRTVLESNDRSIYSSSIAFLFHSTEVNELWDTKQSDIEALLDFEHHLLKSTSEDEQTRQILLGAFRELRRALYFFSGEDLSNETKVRSLYTWMYKVPDDFLLLLKNGNPKALCILAFFCVPLHRLEYNWWFQGWGTHLIDRIHTALDPAHHVWLRWPIQQIGWIPSRGTRRFPYHTTTPAG